MIATGTAILGAAAIGAGASILGARAQSQAAKDAARSQSRATREAMTSQEKALERQIGLQEPFRQSGVNALAEYGAASQYTPFGMDQFNADPGYQFRMSEGLKALERSAASRGILSSGQTLKDITRFGQDTASQEYQNAFQRYLMERQQKLAPLEYRIGLGQGAASGQAANVGGAAQNTGRLIEGQGNINANRAIAQGNAFTGAMGNIADIASQAATGYGQYKAAQPYQNYLAAINNPPMNPTNMGGVY
jgi:hypothetical protein